MMKIDRTPYASHPDVKKLVNANLTWTHTIKWTWAVTIEGKKFEINKAIKPILLEMTKNHCAFCDYLLSSDFFHPSIEHFEPKSKYPEKAYQWCNLYPSCNGCTENKDDRFDNKLLRPDEDTYSFDAFFKVTDNGEILPSDTADENSTENASAIITIEIYKLNRGALVSRRKKRLKEYRKLVPINDPDDEEFRFLIPIAEKVINPDSIINEFIHD